MSAAKRHKRIPPSEMPPSHEDFRIQLHLRRWYDLIKARLPEGASLVVGVQKEARRGVLVSFRAKTEKETFVAEARANDPARAVEEAGDCLYRRIDADFPDLNQVPLKDRLRRIFSDAG